MKVIHEITMGSNDYKFVKVKKNLYHFTINGKMISKTSLEVPYHELAFHATICEFQKNENEKLIKRLEKKNPFK